MNYAIEPKKNPEIGRFKRGDKHRQMVEKK